MEEIRKMVHEESENSHEEHERRHSHHHSSRHHKKHNKILRKVKEYFRKNKKTVTIVVLESVIFLMCLLGVLIWGISQKKGASGVGNLSGNVTQKEDTVSTIVIEMPFFNKEIPLVGEHCIEYINRNAPASAGDIYNEYSKTGRLDLGFAAKLSFEVRGIPKETTILQSKIIIGEEGQKSRELVYFLENNENTIKLYHLKSNTRYEYYVELTFSGGQTINAQGNFKTADTPRMLSIDGIYNVRDIGNWKTVSGQRIKQGLLYRGTELDGAVEAKYTLTANGMRDMLSVLGIRMDMDLRNSTDNKQGTHALGAGVKHIYYNAPAYAGVFEQSGKEAICNIFKDLANPDNYPIYLHCTYGLDRTGTVCYLMEGLLGVSEEDLMRDYQLSAFHHGAVNDEAIGQLITQLKSLEGNTMQEKIEGYLLSTGVTEEEIQSIRSIFLSE